VADDWAALQSCLRKHAVVSLPKGFYRLSRPLVLDVAGLSLVGVGKTLSIIMPMSSLSQSEWLGSNASTAAARPVLEVSARARGVTVSHLTVLTWDHLPQEVVYAMHWAGAEGIWRQAFFNRVQESSFPPFSAPTQPDPDGSSVSAHHPDHPAHPYQAAAQPSPQPGTPFGRPLSLITGGGAFYDFNLDFGCCFGTVLPAPWLPVPPDTASSGEVKLQLPGYRTVLVNGSHDGVRFYPLNAEQDFGEAHTEIRYSSNVSIYGSKSENNFVVVWIRDSDMVQLHGYGGNASPFSNRTRYHAGFPGGPNNYTQFMPSLFRVQRSTRVRFANVMDEGRVTDEEKPSLFIAAGNGTDPRTWNAILHQDGEGVCDPNATPEQCTATRVLDRPVLWEWSGQ
jgi:hypothetical protein